MDSVYYIATMDVINAITATATEDPNPSAFIQFGCWNNLVGNEENVKLVLTQVNQKMTDLENPIDFLLVSGDNYYPEKIKGTDTEPKHKIVDLKKLTDGMNLLPKQKPVYMILGNHDLETAGETEDDKKPEMRIRGLEDTKAQPESPGECSIITNELKSAKSTTNLDSNIEYVFCKSIPMANNTLLFMFDSDIFWI